MSISFFKASDLFSCLYLRTLKTASANAPGGRPGKCAVTCFLQRARQGTVRADRDIQMNLSKYERGAKYDG